MTAARQEPQRVEVQPGEGLDVAEHLLELESAVVSLHAVQPVRELLFNAAQPARRLHAGLTLQLVAPERPLSFAVEEAKVHPVAHQDELVLPTTGKEEDGHPHDRQERADGSGDLHRFLPHLAGYWPVAAGHAHATTEKVRT